MGPWAHTFPHDGVPRPAIGFLQEAVRWWDEWLKGEDTGIMDEPPLRIWMQDSVEPMPQYGERPGRWLAEAGWPSRRLSFSSPDNTGIRGGEWCAFGAEGEMPRDQRPDDGGSLCFDSDPLDADLEILGAPAVELDLESSERVAQVAVRLCDVGPDGSSLRVTYGILNLTHRASHENPEPLSPGERYRIRIQLNEIAHSFPKGHRIRLGLSTIYWPISWPAPKRAILTVHTAVSTLSLPVRKPESRDGELRPFAEPETAPGSVARKLIHLPMKRTVEVDLATNESVYTLKGDGGELDGAALARFEDIDLEVGHQMMKRYRIIEGDPLSAQTEFFLRTRFKRGDWDIRLVCRSKLSATSGHFQFSCDLEAFENGVPVKDRSWTTSIPRRLL